MKHKPIKCPFVKKRKSFPEEEEDSYFEEWMIGQPNEPKEPTK